MDDIPDRIRTQADLELLWRSLMGPWGFGGRSLWFLLIDGEEPIRALTQVEECEEVPTPGPLAGLGQVLRRLVEDLTASHGGALRVAFLTSRPGSALCTEADRAWARGLYAAARTAGVPCEVVHLATHGRVTPLPPDEVGLSA